MVRRSDFVDGRVRLTVSPGDLDAWERCPDALQDEEGAEWPAGDRSAWLDVVPEDPLEVTVHDSPSTRFAVRVPIDADSNCLKENRLRLEHVGKAITPSS
ncbi:DUF5959 family protein [Streptomyces sp. NPDC001292]|uniref:DUF5959 family protein n=1 Tax=Streptomyces sp. NPDC001292 TaxID=3364558 RepID=UPI0036C660FF